VFKTKSEGAEKLLYKRGELSAGYSFYSSVLTKTSEGRLKALPSRKGNGHVS